MGNALLLAAKENATGWLTFNDPGTGNSLSNEMCSGAVLVHGQPSKEAVNDLVRRCFESADFVEGRAAFREKRKPNFRGA